MIKSGRIVSQRRKAFTPTHSLIAVAAIALLLFVALVSTTAQTASEAQFDAKLKTAAAAVDSGLSDVQKFFPASFR